MLIVSALFAITPLVAQNLADNFVTVTRQIADLNPGNLGSFPSNMTQFGESLIFSAYTVSTGTELWKYDGTNITLVADINDTATDLGGGLLEGNSSVPDWLTEFGGALYFSAFDPRRGGELWRFDGSNVVRVADINPDANDAVKLNPNNSWPTQLTVFNGALFFAADGGGRFQNYELWRYDGFTAQVVTNIHPDLGTNHSSFPRNFTVLGDALYFSADDGINGYELWRHTGTNTTLLNLNPGGLESGSYPKFFTVFNGELYFQAFHDAFGFELWKTDGASVVLVTNLNYGSESSFPEFLTPFNGALYFRADDGLSGSELWKFDGTNASLASDINPVGDSYPKNLTVFQGQLYFGANDGINGWELWKYDGTRATLVTNLNTAGDAFPEKLTVHNDRLYFVATTPETGYELWRYDGTNTTLVADVNAGPGSSFPLHPTSFRQELVFSAADNGSSNWEPWSSSLTPITPFEPLRILGIEKLGFDIRLSWATLGGTTNIVQAADNNLLGPYLDLSGPIIIPGTTPTVTNYLDSGGANKAASRFYRLLKP